MVCFRYVLCNTWNKNVRGDFASGDLCKTNMASPLMTSHYHDNTPLTIPSHQVSSTVKQDLVRFRSNIECWENNRK